MAILDFGPNGTGTARAYCELLQLLDRPGAVVQMDDALKEIFGDSAHYRVFSDTTFPCTWAYAALRGRMLIYISGVRTARGLALLSHSYVNNTGALGSDFIVPQIDSWAFDLLGRINAAISGPVTDLTVIGHSLGGAIATAICKIDRPYPNVLTKTCCTFGAPKVTYGSGLSFNNTRYSRWTNPEDNVPSLPPLSAQAPLLYGLLTTRQRMNVEQWKQPQRACSITSTGAISLIEDPPSKAISFTTLLAALESPQGAFGPGHSLSVYQENLARARATYVEPATTPNVPNGPGTVAPPAPPPVVASPRFPQAPLTPAVLAARVTVFREQAEANNGASVLLPFPNQLTRVRRGNVYSIGWMGYEICTCPTKKKAVALCRHMNRFLKIYQGVGMSNSPDFVYALADYLGEASDTDSGYKPLLNDGGNPPNIKIYS